jgi:hypothetical protein
MAEFAFILLRQRRATSLWSQQLLPAGHVPVCPYLDLDYISLLLEFIPAEKHQTIFQRSCLQEFWPEFFKYPGNRDIPADMPSNQPDVELERCLQCCHRLCTEIDEFEALPFLKNLLASKGKIALMLAKRNRVIAVRCAWFLHPIMELVSRQFSRKTCWDEIA